MIVPEVSPKTGSKMTCQHCAADIWPRVAIEGNLVHITEDSELPCTAQLTPKAEAENGAGSLPKFSVRRLSTGQIAVFDVAHNFVPTLQFISRDPLEIMNYMDKKSQEFFLHQARCAAKTVRKTPVRPEVASIDIADLDLSSIKL